MSLSLHDRAQSGSDLGFVRLTLAGMGIEEVSFSDAVDIAQKVPPLSSSLIPSRPLAEGEQYRFHFDMTNLAIITGKLWLR